MFAAFVVVCNGVVKCKDGGNPRRVLRLFFLAHLHACCNGNILLQGLNDFAMRD